MTEAVADNDEPPEFPIGPRDRALLLASGTASGVAGFWVGVLSIPQSALSTPEAIAPVPRSALGAIVIFGGIAAFVAFHEWQLSKEEPETEGSDA